MINTDTLQCHQVPAREVEPTEEMIDWLNSAPIEWSGDEEGVVLHQCEDVLASPGDWICCSQGDWFVLRAGDMEAIQNHPRLP
jgi:hypothetical protein